MRIENIHPNWGNKIILDSPSEFFTMPDDYWRNMLYDRDLILFKNMRLTNKQYIQFGSAFGKTWNDTEYTYSHEAFKEINVNNTPYFISPFSNRISEISMDEMPWHADVPNHDTWPFPIRSLWMHNNPVPESGITQWLNIKEALPHFTGQLLNDIPIIKIVQQSWYLPDTEMNEFEFIKEHPITKKKSLRINWHNDPINRVYDAWIKYVYMYGKRIYQCDRILKPYLDFMETIPELYFEHKWDLFDIVIYDNWSFVHKRTKLDFDPSLSRLFIRLNMHHLNDAEWAIHKEEIKRNFI